MQVVKRVGVNMETTWREWQYTQYRTGQDRIAQDSAALQTMEKKSGKRGHCYFGG